MNRGKFNRDLSDGEFAEDLICEFLISKGYNILERRQDNTWDIKAEKDGFIKTIEVKTDRWEKFNWITNNMIIEVSCSNKPSGIMVTKADYFIYFYPEWELIYIIKSKELKEAIRFRPDLFWRKDGLGDDGKVVGYICNRNEAAELFEIKEIKKNSKWHERDRQKRI
jgi:Holliday junction resolvase-like predicted endonuclease